MKRHPHTCHCTSYQFPHRMGSGKCEAHPSDRLCSECGQPAEAETVDFGIGAYEFWGMHGVHRDVRTVSLCCNAEFMDNDPTTGRYFTALLKRKTAVPA